MSGVMRQLGMYVPQPEVLTDQSNPRGFGEPQWVVDLHSALLSRARVHASDARPTAWASADAVVTEVIRTRLGAWIAEQAAEAAAAGSAELVIKDPRLSWFLAMWVDAAKRCGATPCVVTMLRPPTEVVASKSKSYGGRMADSSRTAAWVNMMLHTELATRDVRRAFVRYHDLLDDWTTVMFQAGETLQLHGVKHAATDNIRRVHQFVDPALRTVTVGWDDVAVPAALRALAAQTWEQLNALVDPDVEQAPVRQRLDELRAEYTTLYGAAERIAESSIIGARSSPPLPLPVEDAPVVARPLSLVDRVAQTVPHMIRAKIPPSVRRKTMKGLARLRGGRR